ncbi:hypothetical protein [Teredinibacter sp. KSP-S5-2]|uniref:hypothetical protein n=1 Tax=Teredinibacter sp. KSP-S5-2 TaxID=3034506 RepID=UPI0029341053|nr:hypothetical protein [Teredinibacter sp. KSP-S5-2]WNO08511.1 hypothetical protein P5V12_16185 [Teredinibacter sp. KSP-S5-2]
MSQVIYLLLFTDFVLGFGREVRHRMNIKTSGYRALFFLTVLFFTSLTHAKSLTILTPEDVLKNLTHYLQGRDVDDIHDFSTQEPRRSVIEVVVLLKALKAGGLASPPILIPLSSDDDSRAGMILKQKEYLMPSGGYWLSTLQHTKNTASQLISAPYVSAGEYEVGLYTRVNYPFPGNISDEFVRSLSAVCNKDWHQDIQVLRSIGIKDLHLVHSHTIMVKMVAFGRADFMLSSFKNIHSDLSYREGNLILTPIPNVKVIFPDSRHWYINRDHPQAHQVFQYLQIGLKKLRENGVLEQAHIASGFSSPKTRDWRILN